MNAGAGVLCCAALTVEAQTRAMHCAPYRGSGVLMALLRSARIGIKVHCLASFEDFWFFYYRHHWSIFVSTLRQVPFGRFWRVRHLDSHSGNAVSYFAWFAKTERGLTPLRIAFILCRPCGERFDDWASLGFKDGFGKGKATPPAPLFRGEFVQPCIWLVR
jgi:hypothetical protein